MKTPSESSRQLKSLDEQLGRRGIEQVARSRCLSLLQPLVAVAPIIIELKVQEVATTIELPNRSDDHGSQIPVAFKGPDKRFRATDKWIEILDSNPKKSRNSIQSTLETGFCIICSGKINMGVLHSVDSCSVLPVIDYPKFACLGTWMRKSVRYDTSCQTCSLKGVQGKGDDSSGTDTSSSTSDGH